MSSTALFGSIVKRIFTATVASFRIRSVIHTLKSNCFNCNGLSSSFRLMGAKNGLMKVSFLSSTKPIIKTTIIMYSNSRIKYSIRRRPVISVFKVKFECVNTTNKAKIFKMPVDEVVILVQKYFQFEFELSDIYHPDDRSNSSRKEYTRKENILTQY